MNRKPNPQIDKFEQLNRQISWGSLQIMHQNFFLPPVDLPNFILTNFRIFIFLAKNYIFQKVEKLINFY